MTKNTVDLFNRLHAAAVRHIAANGIGLVGRDGRSRYVFEAMKADHSIAYLLQEIGTDIPQHAKKCAARLSPVAECDCEVRDRVHAIAEGAT